MLNILKQASAAASETATIDQATDHTAQNKQQRNEFDLDITEADPTPDQVKSILEYLGGANAAGKIVKGASGESDAVSKLKSSPDSFLRPVVCLSTQPHATGSLTSNRLSIGTTQKLVRFFPPFLDHLQQLES